MDNNNQKNKNRQKQQKKGGNKAMPKLSVRVKQFNLPDSPGVYFFKKGRKVLYIGKATSLKDRVKSYFTKDIKFSRSLLIEQMIKEADSVDFIKTDSIIEALILEANLIKKHKPKYNTKEKDDKSFSFVVITDEKYPRVFTMRETDLQKHLKAKSYKLKAIYGPFTSTSLLKEALKIIRKIFPFRGEKDSLSKLNEEIGLSPSLDKISKEEYGQTIKNIRLFFQGKRSQILKNLRIDMKKAAKAREFEKAEKIKRQIFALEHINDSALIKSGFHKGDEKQELRIEAYDVAHIGETDRVGVMVSFKGSEPDKSFYRKFKIKTEKKGDTNALAEILERRLTHPEWPLPKLMVVDGGIAQKNIAIKTLKLYGYGIPVVAVVKGKGHKAREILGRKEIIYKFEEEILKANSEAHRFAIKYHREKRRI